MRTAKTLVAVFAGVALAGAAAWAGDVPPRLKYRAKGPVCSCASGMGEAEIARARSGLDRLRAAEPGQQSGGAEDFEQHQRRRADEDKK